ncbi:Gamma-aminobutyric acid receptor subunit rho-1 [Halotydeus destructor]|nr:Gamma-aminobutyric acid receptor subunit rho-1 [Halotydeus destructor]
MLAVTYLSLQTAAQPQGLPGVTSATYDPFEPPKLGVTVEFEMKLLSVDFINIDDSSISLTFRMIMVWHDDRLCRCSNDTSVYIVGRNHDRLWIPSARMSIVKDGDSMNTAVRAPSLTINMQERKLTYTTTYKVSTYCAMDLTRYPMDTQQCSLDIVPEPLSHKIRPQWMSKELNLTKATSLVNTNAYSLSQVTYGYIRIDAQPLLRVYFTFEKHFFPAVMSIYLPSTLIVYQQWRPTGLSPERAAARAVVFTVPFLSLISLMIGVRRDNPYQYYVTALDIWFIVCMLYCSMAVLVYILQIVFKKKSAIYVRRSPTAVPFILSSAKGSPRLTPYIDHQVAVPSSRHVRL